MRTPSWYTEIDELIRASRIDDARARLARISNARTKPARADAVWLAELHRRVGEGERALRVLGPIVRAKGRSKNGAATHHEITEYAGALIRVSLLHEAIELLETLPEPRTPLAIHYMVLALMGIWDFDAALPWFDRLFTHPNATDHQRRVAAVNLCSSLIQLGKIEEADAQTRAWLPRLRDSGDKLLYGICLNFAAQSAMLAGNHSVAQDLVTQAGQVIEKSSQSVYWLYIRQLAAVIEFRKSGGRDRSAIQAIIQESKERQMWEVIRDLAFQEAVVTSDRDLLFRLYFGTPFSAFRKRVRSEMAVRGFEPPRAYEWLPSTAVGAKRSTKKHLRVSNGSGFGASYLKPGSVPQKILSAATCDFFRPSSLAVLHARAFPDRYFNSISSPDVVHQALKRLRQWLGANRIPLHIEESRGTYLPLALAQGMTLELADPDALNKGSNALEPLYSEYLQRLRNGGLAASFTSIEASDTLGICKTSAVSFLNSACESGLLKKTGAARGTRYSLS